ncbi:hypothetical protein LR48_Vigan03g241200 [Vigna angularis]|uniref:Transposase (putative) gypsy type domain-containing protein n=1 Tax=Phaseolus angularis TaxID=3914 RepID=A0A0L9U8A4_PHAAN|nr:hypothetical protein LR48_Vigan03g241200 [Vigna angularis]
MATVCVSSSNGSTGREGGESSDRSRGGIVIDTERAELAGGWPVIGGYDWASDEVGSYEFDFSTREELRLWAERWYIARDVEDACLIRLGVSHPNELVFHGKGAHTDNFFFVYTYLFNQMFVRVPFTAFQSAVLRRLNVAPSQLHPNGWACIQAFVTMCSALAITPTVSVFLHYFNVRPIAKRDWVSLTFVHDCCLFKPYSESLKNFKHRYFKVIIKEGSRSQFHIAAGGPLFPFYWTRDPAKINVVPVGSMTPVEIEAVKTIDALSRRLPTQNLVKCLGHEDFDQMPRKTSYVLSSRKRDPRSRGSSHGLTAAQSRMVTDPPVMVVVAQPAPVVNLESSEAAAVPPTTALDKKRKSKEEKLSSKRSRQENSAPHPLPGGLFNPTFNVGGRGAMLVWYLREFANRRNAMDVQAALAAKKKVVKDLRAQLEALTLENKDCGKQQSKLQEEMDEVRGELSTTAQQLKDTRSRSDRIVEEAGRLKLEARQLAEREKELQSKVDRLIEEVERANEAIATLNTNAQIEHFMLFESYAAKRLCWVSTVRYGSSFYELIFLKCTDSMIGFAILHVGRQGFFL